MAERVVRMREPAYFVLASLADGPLSGYAIIRDAQQLSGGRVRLTTGALFTLLDRLGGVGYIQPVSEEWVAGGVRRSYGLTRSGLSWLRADAPRQAGAGGLVTSPSGGEGVRTIVSVGSRVRLGRNAGTT